jgi:hypothetical protein
MTAGDGGSLSLLRHRDFRLLFLGQGISVFGDRMVAVALAFAVIEVGGSASDVGLASRRAWSPRWPRCWPAVSSRTEPPGAR